MAGSPCMILYTVWYIEQWHGVVRLAVEISDFYRKQWWVGQWFHTTLFIHYTGIFTTTKSQTSRTMYSAIWRLFTSCEYMRAWRCIILLHALTNHFRNEFCNNTSTQNKSRLMSASHCTGVPVSRLLIVIMTSPKSVAIYSLTRSLDNCDFRAYS